MNRKDFISRVVPAAALAVTGLSSCKKEEASSANIITSPSISWKLTSSFPRSLDLLFGGAEFFAERVKQLTDGKFVIRVYPAGELVPGLQVFDAIQQGTVQMGQTSSYYFTGKHPALAFESGVPFGLTARQQNAWMYHAGGMELMKEIMADFNIVSLPAGNTGCQMGGWFRREINSVADLKGIKMRIPGLGGQVMDKLGASVQVLAGGEIFPALERGAIDATEWVGPYDDEKLGFHKIVKNYYYPGWWEPSTQFSIYVNRAEWEKLPKTYQEAVTSAASESNIHMLASYDAHNPAALSRLVASGVKLKKFSDEIMQTTRQVSRQIMEDQAAADARYRKVYQSWQKFREESFRWFSTSEMAYASYAFSAK